MSQISDTVLADTFTKFVADHNAVKNRMGLGVNNGETSELGSIAFFDQQINTSVTVPGNKRALGIDTVVPSGVTVTVASGGSFVVL